MKHSRNVSNLLNYGRFREAPHGSCILPEICTRIFFYLFLTHPVKNKNNRKTTSILDTYVHEYVSVCVWVHFLYACPHLYSSKLLYKLGVKLHSGSKFGFCLLQLRKEVLVKEISHFEGVNVLKTECVSTQVWWKSVDRSGALRPAHPSERRLEGGGDERTLVVP